MIKWVSIVLFCFSSGMLILSIGVNSYFFLTDPNFINNSGQNWLGNVWLFAIFVLSGIVLFVEKMKIKSKLKPKN